MTMLYHSLLHSDNDNAPLILSSLLSNKLPHSKDDTMDHLYRAILRSIRHLAFSSLNVFDVLIKSPRPLTFPHLYRLACIPVRDKFTELDSVADTLQWLTLIRERELDDQGASLIGVHPSLEDFLTNPRRCHGTGLYVDRELPLKTAPEVCLDIMNHLLKHNICKFDDVMALNGEVSDLAERTQKTIYDNPSSALDRS